MGFRPRLGPRWTGGARRSDEHRWPTAGRCVTTRTPTGWQIDYRFPAPKPPPFTTIAWRLVHIANGNWIRWQHALGPAQRSFLDREVPSTAVGAVAYWRDSAAPIAAWLATASPTDLERTGRTVYGEAITAGETVRILLCRDDHGLLPAMTGETP